MTKKDYELIARTIKQYHPCLYEAETSVTRLARELTIHFKRDNPRFDETRFLTACGIQD